MARTFTSLLLEIVPPWLKRTRGRKFLEALGTQLDALADRMGGGVKLRFPTPDGDEIALAYIGRERRIRRGPNEPANTYAARLPQWWDDHRTRGGPYALLRQLYAYFRFSLNTRMDVVYHSGTRRWVDEAGVITRDAITWEADGTENWSNAWVFFHLGEQNFTTLVTVDGDPYITFDGVTLIALSGNVVTGYGEVTEEWAEVFKAIPREWSAAHLPYVAVVLLWGVARLWDYPQPVPTWDEWEASGATWDLNNPVVLIAE